jgi:hypothetical protein
LDWKPSVPFETAQPNPLDAGIYVIWQSNPPHKAVRVGQGVICNRFSDHRIDPTILRHRNPTLVASWANVEPRLRDGVERFLAELLLPAAGERFPDCVPIPVNMIGE